MTRCAEVRPLLTRVADADAAPVEAMQVAQHLSDCTACRILLARERHLSRLLDRDLADLPLGGDACVDAIMSTIPAGPPPATVRRARLRVVESCALAGLAIGASALARAVWLPLPGLPRTTEVALGPEAAASIVENVLSLGRAAGASLEMLAAIRHSTALPEALFGLCWASLLATPVLVLLGAGGLAVALVGRRVVAHRACDTVADAWVSPPARRSVP